MKSFINKILDVPKLILTIWIILWVILVILLVFKFCFGMWYPVISKNESFIAACNYMDNNKVFSLIIMGIFYYISANLICLTALGQKFYKNIIIGIIINIFIIGTYILKIFNSLAGNIVEFCYSAIFISIINLKQNNFDSKLKNILIPIIYYGLLNLWQFTMLVVRNVDGLVLSDLSNFIGLILQIDYYIFIIISWIGVSIMGLWSIGWFWSKDITVLKAEKDKELAKANPNMKKIESIDIRIAELEKEAN